MTMTSGKWAARLAFDLGARALLRAARALAPSVCEFKRPELFRARSRAALSLALSLYRALLFCLLLAVLDDTLYSRPPHVCVLAATKTNNARRQGGRADFSFSFFRAISRDDTV